MTPALLMPLFTELPLRGLSGHSVNKSQRSLPLFLRLRFAGREYLQRRKQKPRWWMMNEEKPSQQASDPQGKPAPADEEQTQHPEERAEGSQEEGVEAPSEEEAQATSGGTTAPVSEEEVSEEDAAPAAGPEASPGSVEEDK